MYKNSCITKVISLSEKLTNNHPSRIPSWDPKCSHQDYIGISKLKTRQSTAYPWLHSKPRLPVSISRRRCCQCCRSHKDQREVSIGKLFSVTPWYLLWPFFFDLLYQRQKIISTTPLRSISLPRFLPRDCFCFFNYLNW